LDETGVDEVLDAMLVMHLRAAKGGGETENGTID